MVIVIEFGAMGECVEREWWVVCGGGMIVFCVCAVHVGYLFGIARM